MWDNDKFDIGRIIRLGIIYIIVSISLSKCSSKSEEVQNDNKEKSSNETFNDNTNATSNNQISYLELAQCILLEINNKESDLSEYKIVRREEEVGIDENFSSFEIISYIDIISNSPVAQIVRTEYNLNNTTNYYNEVDYISNFLLSYNYVQTAYTTDDINNLLSLITNDLKNQKDNNKVNSK